MLPAAYSGGGEGFRIAAGKEKIRHQNGRHKKQPEWVEPCGGIRGKGLLSAEIVQGWGRRSRRRAKPGVPRRRRGSTALRAVCGSAVDLRFAEIGWEDYSRKRGDGATL